jgi:hypothetical protein
MGGPTQGLHADKRCGVQHPEEPCIEDDAGTPGPALTLSDMRSREVALKEEQGEQLDSNHSKNWATGKDGEADHMSLSEDEKRW